MSILGDWITTYLRHLRPELRADSGDKRLQEIARIADHNGWTPDQAAQQVNAGDYTTARNPPVIAIYELERLAEDPPTIGLDIRPIGCQNCSHGWIDHPDGHVTTPCPTCRPQLAARVARSPAPGKRTPDEIQYLRHKRTMR